MSYFDIATRTTSDANAAVDINQLMENINVVRKSLIDEILLKIENLEVIPALCDPLNISSKFIIADGSAIPSDSEAYIIHNTGGTLFSGTYFERTFTGKGLVNIPDLRGYHQRFFDKGAAVDPDRANRRQGCTGTVDTTSGTIIYLPKYYINIISEAVSNSRAVIIGLLNSTIFTDPTVYGTVQSVNTSLNYVVLTSITGSFTSGSASLVINGDVLGSFQMDQFESHYHQLTVANSDNDTNESTNVAFSNNSNTTHIYTMNDNSRASTPVTDGTYPVRAGAESRGKNIALLPLVRVYL